MSLQSYTNYDRHPCSVEGGAGGAGGAEGCGRLSIPTLTRVCQRLSSSLQGFCCAAEQRCRFGPGAGVRAGRRSRQVEQSSAVSQVSFRFQMSRMKISLSDLKKQIACHLTHCKRSDNKEPLGFSTIILGDNLTKLTQSYLLFQ